MVNRIVFKPSKFGVLEGKPILLIVTGTNPPHSILELNALARSKYYLWAFEDIVLILLPEALVSASKHNSNH